MTRKILQWRDADRERFKSVHWVTTRAKDDRELATLTGIVATDLKGVEGGEWRYEDVVLGLALPTGYVPAGKAFQVEHWAPFVTLNAIYDKETAVNAGWAVDSFSGPGPVKIEDNGRFRIETRIGVRDVDGWLFRIGITVTLSGVIVPA